MVWSLIATVTGILLAVGLWFTADMLEKKKAMKHTDVSSDNQEEIANYED